MARPSAAGVLGASFLAGSIPFSGLAARLLAGVDLREHGTGTVSGTGLHEVTGFAPLAVAGTLEVAVGAVGPLLAGPDRPVLGAVGAGLAAAGHNWSPWLGGAGGRGISTVLGGGLALAPEATVVVGAGLGLGRLVKQTGLGCFVALLALFPVLRRRRGPTGAAIAICLALPVLLKRALGNHPRSASFAPNALVHRIVFDEG